MHIACAGSQLSLHQSQQIRGDSSKAGRWFGESWKSSTKPCELRLVRRMRLLFCSISQQPPEHLPPLPLCSGASFWTSSRRVERIGVAVSPNCRNFALAWSAILHNAAADRHSSGLPAVPTPLCPGFGQLAAHHWRPTSHFSDKSIC